jgi:hypothetical protein
MDSGLAPDGAPRNDGLLDALCSDRHLPADLDHLIVAD